VRRISRIGSPSALLARPQGERLRVVAVGVSFELASDIVDRAPASLGSTLRELWSLGLSWQSLRIDPDTPRSSRAANLARPDTPILGHHPQCARVQVSLIRRSLQINPLIAQVLFIGLSSHTGPILPRL
jgi:hypothetical protein